MNKDVIYIEPEDDITDIITKIEKSKEKIVALVPPKKAGVFRSVVNIKLIAKSGAAAEKTIVLVTVDPSIVKLAAATKLPVTKDLQTAPVIPKADTDEDNESKEELVAESDDSREDEGDKEEDADDDSVKEDSEDESKEDDEREEPKDDKGEQKKDEEDDDDDDDETPFKKGDKADKEEKKKPAKSRGGLVGWVKDHKKITIFGSILCVCFIVFLVWALVIAPAVTVTVAIKTESVGFSKNVTFTTKLEEEKASEGKFYLEEKKTETPKEVKFEATGKKNVGKNAGGDVVVYAYFKDKGTVQVGEGSVFTFSGMNFTADETVTLSWDGATASDCENNGQASAITSGCLISGRVAVTAAEPGSAYNVAASNTGWNTVVPVGVYSDKAMSGGTDETITVVQQSDIDKAKAEITSTDEHSQKEELMDKVEDGEIMITSSFSQSAGEAVSTPAVGEEVKEGVTPTLKVTTTASLYVIDKIKVEEFISAEAKLSDSEKIYEMKDPFVESFMKTDSGYAGKLKTTYMVGPKVTTASIIELIKGKGFGDAKNSLKDLSNVTDMKFEGSFPWVNSVPNDTNKITVNLEIKDQDGNKVEHDDKQDANASEEKKDESADKKSENSENSEEKK